jgi:hypothetical protein
MNNSPKPVFALIEANPIYWAFLFTMALWFKWQMQNYSPNLSLLNMAALQVDL